MKESMNMNNHEHNHDQEKMEFFNKEQPLFDKIYLNGFASYAESLENLKNAFEGNDFCLRCIDEGTPGGVHSAGSGILRNKEEVIAELKASGIKKITSHDGCGAAGIFAASHGLDASKSDDYGKEWSSSIAKELGIPYEHIGFSEMNRPEKFHVARAAYYDKTGKFDYSKVKELPSGFIVNSGIQESTSSLSDVELAFKIAIGSHGSGDLITEENPFLFVAVADNEEDLELLKSDLNKIKESLGSRVRVEGFLAPKE